MHLHPSRFLLVCLAFCAFCAPPIAYGEKESTLNSFYIAAHVFSDYGPSFFEYILDVQPDGSGSRVRHMRLAPASIYCPSVTTIRAIEKTVASPPDRLLDGVSL